MNNRYVESPNNMAPRAEKRSSDASSSEEGQPQRKRPALASVIIEALKVNSLQKLCSSLEPILRKVVSEEVERALAKLGPANNAKLSGRVSPKRIEGPDGRKLQLHFRSKLSLPLFTGGKVEGEYGAPIHVVLLDANTGHVVTHGPESSARLDVVVLEGDFNGEEEEDGQGWTEEEFESHIVKEREGKRPLLTGDLQVVLKQGVGTLGELTFTDNSSWIRSRKFRLGLRVAASSSGFEGFRIREAKTNAFMVKDHRGELYKKHYPPTLNDEVWRLEKIGKDGSFHKRLNVAGIHTVEDFLRLVVRDQQKLRSILGTGMSNKMWEALIEHSKTCVLSEKLYIYYPDEPRNVGVVFNNIYELIGLIVGGMYQSLDSLSDNQKVYVDALVKKAYDNWAHVIEYDGKSLMGFNQSNNMSDSSQTDHNRVRSHHQPSSFDHHSLPSLPPSVSPENPLNLGGYRDNIGGGGKYTMQSQSTNANVPHQYSNASLSFAPQQPVVSNSNNVLALGPPASTSSEFSIASASSLASSYRENRSVPEDEIRLRSHEMLEADDMQQLLRMYSMGGHHGIDSFNAQENNYGFSAFTPFTPSNFVFEEDRTRSSGKAVVGWLKLKAALRWGIFVRKKAAEKRAQITELDDESLT